MTAQHRQVDEDHVLVTGGAGFIGQHVVARALADGKHVTVLDDFSTGTRGSLGVHPRLRVVEGSVLDARALREAARGVTHVQHLASVVGMRLAVAERERAWRVAVEGTRAVLDATANCPTVLFSSSAVYGVRCANPAQEDAPTESDALEYDGGERGYASGKRALEQLGLDAASHGRDVLVVRPFNVVGRGQRGSYGMVLPTFIERARSGRALTVYNDGHQSRAFSDVVTFVEALARLIAAPRSQRVVNIGAPRSTTVMELARFVTSELGVHAPIEHVPYASVFPGRHDVPARLPDTSRLTEIVGPLVWPSTRDIVRELVAQPAQASVDT